MDRSLNAYRTPRSSWTSTIDWPSPGRTPIMPFVRSNVSRSFAFDRSRYPSRFGAAAGYISISSRAIHSPEVGVPSTYQDGFPIVVSVAARNGESYQAQSVVKAVTLSVMPPPDPWSKKWTTPAAAEAERFIRRRQRYTLPIGKSSYRWISVLPRSSPPLGEPSNVTFHDGPAPPGSWITAPTPPVFWYCHPVGLPETSRPPVNDPFFRPAV